MGYSAGTCEERDSLLYWSLYLFLDLTDYSLKNSNQFENLFSHIRLFPKNNNNQKNTPAANRRCWWIIYWLLCSLWGVSNELTALSKSSVSEWKLFYVACRGLIIRSDYIWPERQCVCAWVCAREFAFQFHWLWYVTKCFHLNNSMWHHTMLGIYRELVC